MPSPPDVSDFVTTFPEMAPAGALLIGSKLVHAELQVDYSVYGQGQGDLAVLYLAAHLLALSPFGQTARLSSKDGSSVYEKTYRNLQTQAAAGYRST